MKTSSKRLNKSRNKKVFYDNELLFKRLNEDICKGGGTNVQQPEKVQLKGKWNKG
jgi:hypothetical protein